MQLKTNILLLMYLPAIFGTGFSYKENAEIVHDTGWTGIISYSYHMLDKGTGSESDITGQITTDWIFFRHAEILIEVNGNKGIAKMTDKLTRWERKISPFTGNKKHVQIITADERGEGKGDVEVWVEINDDGTYWLKTSGPEYTSQVSSRTWINILDLENANAPANFSTRTNDGIPIDAPDQPMSKNATQISGRYVIFSSKTHYVVVNWNLRKKSVSKTVRNQTPALSLAPDVELIVTPESYNDWLPKAGSNEITPGSKGRISLRLQGKNGTEPPVKAQSFELKLFSTTTAGMCSAATLGGQDIRFLSQPPAKLSDDGQFLMIPCLNGKTGEVIIGSFHDM